MCLQCGRPGFNPWVGKIPCRRQGYPLQYSGLENSMDCIVHGFPKSRTRLSDFHFHFSPFIKELVKVLLFLYGRTFPQMEVLFTNPMYISLQKKLCALVLEPLLCLLVLYGF